MKRLGASVGSVLFFVVAPGVVAGLVPWWISRWQMQPPFLGWRSLRVAGVALIVLGTPALLDSFVRFALEGRGTPAPVLARVLRYGAAVWLAFFLFVVGYEEPTLRRTFGEEYERFCANVPRWIPRLRPWRGE